MLRDVTEKLDKGRGIREDRKKKRKERHNETENINTKLKKA